MRRLICAKLLRGPEWVSPLPTEPHFPMTKAALAVRATKIGTSSLLSTTPATLLLLLSPFALPLTHTGPQQTNYLNCLGESNGRTFRP